MTHRPFSELVAKMSPESQKRVQEKVDQILADIKLSEMSEIKCAIKGCNEVFKTNEPALPNARFICKNHPRSEQVKAAGRVYDPENDEKDRGVHFQEHAFDRNLGSGPAPAAE